jgi:transposase-like protein
MWLGRRSPNFGLRLRSSNPVMVELLGRYSKMNSQVVKLRELLIPGPDQPVPAPRRTKQHQTRLLPDRLEAFADAYQAGMTAPDLAEAFQINRATVFRIVERLGLPHHIPILGAEEIEEACRLYMDGYSLVAVSQRLPVSPNTIRKELLRRGITLRSAHDRHRG